MSIDAQVIGIRKLDSENIVKLTLGPSSKGGIAGQESLHILNSDQLDMMILRNLIGQDIWGGSGEIMLGDTKLATREGYVGIILVDNWVEVIRDVLQDS